MLLSKLMNMYGIFRYRKINKLSEILIIFILSRIIISMNYVIDNLTSIGFRVRIDLMLVNNMLKKVL
jgi:hypothetical protein